MLTGKALEYFNEWRWECMGQIEFDLLPKLLQYALIIEWFDLVQIDIHTDITDEYYIGKIYRTSLNYPDFIDRYYHVCDREYVIKQLIEKANGIYNANLI